ncbi:MAG TPA: hypothetical protein VM533_03735 [Fimbriiglobus sp.]|nr:hypothetical protein [Fimbriiglobus sp.]
MDGSPAAGFRLRPWWLLAVALVTVGQARLAVHLFGSAEGIADSRPLVGGRHPLHLYHGFLGAATFHDRSATACYDPDFQAGYPKTPVFDGGSRPAELFLTLAGGGYDPAAYKRGLYVVCALAPLAFVVAARGLGLSAAGSCLAGALGCVVWWSPPVRAMLDAGDLDLLLAGLMALAYAGALSRYATEPGPVSWLLMAVVLVVGWYAHPVVWLGLVPVGAAYYVITAPRHGLAWHLGLIGSGVAGLALNLWWLTDWLKFWWLRQPSADDFAPLPAVGSLVGGPGDFTAILGPGLIGWALLAAGVGGLVGMARAGLRTEAGLVVAVGGLAALVARLGATWPTFQAVAADRAAPFAVAALAVPAAWLAARWVERATVGPAAAWAACGLPLVLGWAPLAAGLGLNLTPLPRGLTHEQEQLVAALRQHTTPEARVLIEEPAPSRPGWNWTALLPVLTDRAYLGGLDPDACVEHSFCGMRDGRLNGRAFDDWTPFERSEFCRRYNVGWVVCRSPEAVGWWSRDPSAKEVGRFRDGDEVVLFELARPRSFVLTGKATWERADRRKVVLADVVPNEAGEVVLSLHYQPGVRVSPTKVVMVEGDKDLFDPIPMVKLRTAGPVSRVTLTWENP